MAPLQIEQITLPGDADQTEAPLDFIAENEARRAQVSIEDAFSPPPAPPAPAQEPEGPFVDAAPEAQDTPSEAAAEQAPRACSRPWSARSTWMRHRRRFWPIWTRPLRSSTPSGHRFRRAAARPQPRSHRHRHPPVQPVPVAADAGIFGGFGDSDIDDDIRDVFLEEFDEELVNLGQLLPVWRAAPNSPDKLRTIRRVFHTLKGSGRLVGASVLGEFSWKIESMLNRVLDNSRPPSPAVVAMVGLAYEVLPQFNAALRDQGRISADLPEIQAIAERVAAGEEVYYVPAAATPATTEVAAVLADAGAPAASGEPRHRWTVCCAKSSKPRSPRTWKPSTPGCRPPRRHHSWRPKSCCVPCTP